jgi:hypothetical protein
MTVGMLAFKAIGTATILLAASGYAAADSYVLLGNGVCRAAGVKGTEFVLRTESWEECRRVCSSRKCGGIEFNVTPDSIECEHHYYPVKVMQVQQHKGKLHSCWARQN